MGGAATALAQAIRLGANLGKLLRPCRDGEGANRVLEGQRLGTGAAARQAWMQVRDSLMTWRAHVPVPCFRACSKLQRLAVAAAFCQLYGPRPSWTDADYRRNLAQAPGLGRLAAQVNPNPNFVMIPTLVCHAAQVNDLGRLAAEGDAYGLLALGQQLVEGRTVAQDYRQVSGALPFVLMCSASQTPQQ